MGSIGQIILIMPASWKVPVGMIDVPTKSRQHDQLNINYIQIDSNKLKNQISPMINK